VSPTFRPTLAVAALALLATLAAPAARGAEADRAWSASLGLSWVATTGNADTTTAGVDLDATRKGAVWELAAKLSALRASKDGTTTAERYLGRFRGRRSLGTRWGLAAGLSAERDRFAGLALRSVLDLGASARFRLGEDLSLELGLGTTWTHERREAEDSRDAWGGLVSTDLGWRLSETATFRQSLDLYPSFTDTSAYRVEAETALEAAINRHLALKLGWELRYTHRPPAGKVATDTTTRASLVLRF